MSNSDCTLQCPPVPTSCTNCSPGQQCQIVISTCTACGYAKCVDPPSTSSSGVSKGALAGAIIGILISLALILSAVWFWRKRSKARADALRARALESKSDLPASAEVVLSRRDPVEKPRTPSSSGHVRVFSGNSNRTINLHSGSQRTNTEPSAKSSNGSVSALHNPFADDLSIGGSERSEPSAMIPITVLPYGSMPTPTTEGSNPLSQSQQLRANATSPLPHRPVRSPDLDLIIDGQRSTGPPSSFDLAHVNISNDSVPRPSANIEESVRSELSAGSRASYMSTGTYATDLFTESPTIVTRQQGRILGLSKAQVVEVPSSLSSAGSPLASSHLTPTMSRLSRMTASRSIRSPLAQQAFSSADIIEMNEQPEPSPFDDTHAQRKPAGPSVMDGLSIRSDATFDSAALEWGMGDTDSVASGVEASITSAKRVVISPQNRVVSQSSTGSLSGKSNPHRYSFVSEASSRADSILEAFPFVPPSLPPTPRSQHTFKSAEINQVVPVPQADDTPSSVMDPEVRRRLGMSTATQGSSASSGLESFPFHFQIDSSSERPPAHLPSKQPDRASLDTLALSRDLAAFPLAYDEDTERSAQAKYVGPSRKSSTTHKA